MVVPRAAPQSSPAWCVRPSGVPCYSLPLHCPVCLSPCVPKSLVLSEEAVLLPTYLLPIPAHQYYLCSSLPVMATSSRCP